MSMAGMSRWWGPVFDAERTTRARRWQGYALRALFVLGLLGGLVLVWVDQSRQAGVVSVQAMATAGASAYGILTMLQLVAVLLVAPAATAGAICLDKSRGSLAHVFVTDLSNREIVLGKLAARLLPVWGLLACALPVAAMATWLGGIDPMALTGAFVIAAGVAVLGCAFALVLSVWAGKPHEVISVVFGVFALWLLACPVYELFQQGPRPPLWLERTNAFYLTSAPYDYPGETSLIEPLLFSLGCVGVGAVCLAVAVAKVRVVGCRSAREQARRVGLIGRCLARIGDRIRWGKGPQLDADPVLWREWHRNRPSRWSKFVWGGFEILSVLACLSVITVTLLESWWWTSGGFVDEEIPGLVIGVLATLGLLLVSASAASVLAEERARGSLDVLISTPVSTRSILRAKWRGAFRPIPWLAFWPIVVGIVYLNTEPRELAQVAIVCLVPALIVVQGATLVSLGLALATWIKRTGQATAWTITTFVAAVVGWPIVGTFLLFNDPTAAGSQQARQTIGFMVREYGLALGSPFYNVALPLVLAYQDQTWGKLESEGVLILVVAWTVIYALVAWGLFEATVRTFDRCLGRVSERPSAPRLAPPPVGTRARRLGWVRGWGWRTPGAAGRPAGRAASFAPPPR